MRASRHNRSAFAALVIAAFAFCAAPAGASAFGPLSGFGSLGEGAGQFRAPNGLAVAADGTTYVADTQDNRIAVFDSQGTFRFAFGRDVNPGGGNICTAASGCKAAPEVTVSNPVDLSVAGTMNNPQAVAVGPEGNLFVVDEANRRIDVFTSGGEFLFAFGKTVNADPAAANRNICTAASGCGMGSQGNVAGAVTNPSDVEIGPGGRLAVSSARNRRIDVFTSAGEFLFAFGKGVNADPAAANPDLCTAAGGCQEGVENAAAGAFITPTSIAIDGSGNIYVTDQRLNRVDQFSGDGSFVGAFGAGVVDGSASFQICTLACRPGSEAEVPGSTPGAGAIALDCRGALYVSSLSPGAFSRVERFGEPGTPPAPCATSSGPKPSNKFKLGKLVLNRKKGTAVLLAQVPGPGRLVLKGKGLKTAKRVARAAGQVKLAIKPIGKAKRKLAMTGALKLKAKVTFTPTGGASAGKTIALRLRQIR